LTTVYRRGARSRRAPSPDLEATGGSTPGFRYSLRMMTFSAFSFAASPKVS
jgi:hypothetical protein